MRTYEAKDVRRILGVNNRWATYVAEIGLVEPIEGKYIGRGGMRHYTKEAILKMSLVRDLRLLGLEFSAIKDILYDRWDRIYKSLSNRNVLVVPLGKVVDLNLHLVLDDMREMNSALEKEEK